MTSKSQTRSASRHENDQDRTQILSDSRSVRVVLYSSTPAESEHRFWIDPEVTFGDLAKALAGMYPSQELVVLQANWGPKPSWTESQSDSRIGSTCRVLYAISKDQAKPYTMGVVRTSLSDYPIPIYIPASESSMTLLEAVIASYPKLTGQVKSIVLHFGDYDLQDDPWDNAFAQGQQYPATPLLITSVDEPSKEFLAGSLYEAFSPSSPKASTSNDSDGLIPPLLQISFAECKLLVQRAYELDAFPLQMIHLSEAIFHIVISLARSLTPVFENTSSSIGDALSAEDDLADHLRVAPFLCRQLEELLNAANEIMDTLELDSFEREGTQRAIENIFFALCGDLPGAVTVRCSEKDFKKFGGIDYQSIMEAIRVANADPMMDLDYQNDVGNLPYPSSELDRHFPSGKGSSSEAASTLWYPDIVMADPTETSGGYLRPLTPNSEEHRPSAYTPLTPGGEGLSPSPHSPDPEVIGEEKAGEGIRIVSPDGGGPRAMSNLSSLTRAMDPNHPAGVLFRQDGKGSKEDYPAYPSRPISSSGNNQRYGSVVNYGATGNFFHQDPHSVQFSQQKDLIPDPQTYQSEYDQFSRHHAPPAEHDHLHQSLPINSFMGVDAGMHSTASSSSSVLSVLRTLTPGPSHSSAPNPSSYASPIQRPHEIPQRTASSQYPSYAQSSLPLQAMVSNGQGPSEPDPIKLSYEQTEAIKALLRQHGWYTALDEEPTISPDDPFIAQGLILPTDKTRFSAFVLSSSTSGKTFCRIRHSIPTKKGPIDCTFSAVHPRDAIAHVCNYLNYKPYKCKGKGVHMECGSAYPTKERRNDHYAKKKKGPDTFEVCKGCGASITIRNVPRHRGKCPNTNNLW